MHRKLYSYLAAGSTLMFIILVGPRCNAQSPAVPFTFRAGQSMYIVAFRRERQAVIIDPVKGAMTPPEYPDLELDAEKRVRERIEEWRFFRVAEKPSEADFVFLVSLDDSSIEGLAISVEAYRRHFKDKFDLDALREAAFGRYLAGPLKLSTLSRLSERLIKQFRAKVTNGGPAAR